MRFPALLGLLGACAFAGAVGVLSLMDEEPDPGAGQRAALAVAADPQGIGGEAAGGDLPPLPEGIPAPPGLPFPVDIEVKFDLTDHFGKRVTEQSYRGQPMILFFGYANCESICTVALPRMGEALALLGDQRDNVAALMITIDPEYDTPDYMRENLPRWHDNLVGLTGSEAELKAVYERFQVNIEEVAEDPAGRPIYAHGSFIYFIDADGTLKTMVPPILSAERMAELARKYFPQINPS